LKEVKKINKMHVGFSKRKSNLLITKKKNLRQTTTHSFDI